LDKVVTSEISKFEAKFLNHLRTNHPKLLEAIRTSGELTKQTENELKGLIESFLAESGLAMKAWEK